MPDLSDFTAKGQDFMAKAVDAVRANPAVDAVLSNPTVEKALDMVPTPGEVVDTVTATANELISLSQDVQNKVLTALKWNV